MNKSFKVVFSKARGALMAVNEATSSVQAKGTKTIIAAATVALMSGAAIAQSDNLDEGVNITPAQNAGAYIGKEGFVTTTDKVAIEQVGDNTDNTWKITADGYGTEEGANNTYGAVVNNSTNSYVNGVDAVHIAEGSSFKNNKAQYGAGLIIFQEGQGSTGHEATNNANTITGSTFEFNEATQSGGALAFMANGSLSGRDGTTTISGSTFSNNKAGAVGGAIYVEGTNLIVENSEFIGNHADSYGGAIAIHSTATSLQIKESTTFKENTAGTAGGAIFSSGDGLEHTTASVSVGNSTTFTSNSARSGGAIFNQRNDMTIAASAKFTGNHANGDTEGGFGEGGSDNGSGGAIMNQADQTNKASVDIGINAEFTSNTASVNGGAIANYAWSDSSQFANSAGNVQMMIGDGATFTGNSAGSQGGAIYNDGTLTFEGSAKFYNNGKTDTTSNGPTSGGAISNAGTMTLETSYFEGNSSQSMGGAVFNSGAHAQISFNDKVIFKYNHSANGGALFNSSAKNASIADGAEFTGNNAEYAGAIYNHLSTLTIGNELRMEGNYTTDGSAGAIANDNAGVIKIGASAKFLGNTSARSGGAIYQYITSEIDGGSSFTIGDGALFSGNKAESNGGAAAVYSGSSIESTMTFGANVKFDGNEAQGQGGAIYLASNNTVNFEGDATFSGNTASNVLNDIHNDGIVNVKGGTLSLDGGITGSGMINFADGSALNVIVRDEQETSTTITNKVVLGDNVSLSMTFAPGYEGEYQLITEGGSLTGTFDLVENALFDVTADKDKNGTFTIKLKDSGELAESIGADSNQAAAIDAIMSAEGGSEAYAAVVESISSDLQSNDAGRKQAALDAVTAMSPETAPMVAQIQTDTAAQVFSVIGTRLGGSQGMASGDGTSGTALWVQGMVGTTDMEDTGSTHGYSADTTGLALGLEAKPTQSTTVGMGFAYTSTDVDGFLRSTDVDNMTAFLYGEYKPADWYVNGILSYAWANYDEDRSVAGTAVSAKYDADTFGVQVMGGVNLDAAGFTVSPEAGLRYARIGTDGYTDSLGISVADSDEDVLTGVAGVRLAKAFEVSPAMTVKPEVRLAMTYDFVDADNRSFVTLANGSSYAVDGETLDRFAFEAGIGVKAEMGDNFELALSYEGAWRSDFQNHAGLLNAKYKF